jgi:hypothetical protein
LDNPLENYVKHSPITYLPDEPKIKSLLGSLPGNIPELVKVVQNTLLHIFWAERYGEKLDEKRSSEVKIRSVADKLRLAYEYKPISLTENRDLSEKVVGNCRDYTVLTVSLMRCQGIPARARCGFGAYFSTPDMRLKYVDHWVVEYWNFKESRWVMVDSQLDEFQQNALDIDFDPLDVPSNKFITGGAAWKMCRCGEADSSTFGIFEMSGLGFIRGDMIRDLASLGKMPLLPWDCWGAMLDENLDEVELLDEVSEVTQPGTLMYDKIDELNMHPRLRVPDTIVSWMGETEPFKVNLKNVIEKLPNE